MHTRPAGLRRFARWAGAPLALLFGLAVLVGAVHHHAGPAHDPCAICTVSHAPAVAPTLSVAPATPARDPERIVVSGESAAREIAPAEPSSRGPPTV